MTDQPQQTNPNEHRYYPEDEVELMDYLLVIWKWKYIILAGTLAFAVTAGLISFFTWKPPPQKYRTNMVFQPGILKINKNGQKIFIDSQITIKALIENELKYKVLDNIKSSNSTNLSTSFEFQVNIPVGSNVINVSLESASVDEGTTKTNLMIKALLDYYSNKIKYIQGGYDKDILIVKKKINLAYLKTEEEQIKKKYLNQIEIEKDLLAKLKEKETIARKKIENQIGIKKTLLAELKEKETIARKKIEDKIQLKKMKLNDLLFEEKRIKNKIENYQQRLSELESKIKLLKERGDNSPSPEYFLNKLSIEFDYRNTFQKHLERNENAKYNLIKIQKKIADLSKKIEVLEKTKESNEVDPTLQPGLHKIKNDIIRVSKEIEKLQRVKESNEVDPILQPSLYKIKNDIISLLKKIEKLEKGKKNIQDDKTYGDIFFAKQKQISLISKEIEKAEKEKLNIQNVQIIQQPVTIELPKTKAKIKRNIILSSIVGLFLMIFLSFLVEYLPRIKNIWIKRQLEIKNE